MLLMLFLCGFLSHLTTFRKLFFTAAYSAVFRGSFFLTHGIVTLGYLCGKHCEQVWWAVICVYLQLLLFQIKTMQMLITEVEMWNAELLHIASQYPTWSIFDSWHSICSNTKWRLARLYVKTCKAMSFNLPILKSWKVCNLANYEKHGDLATNCMLIPGICHLSQAKYYYCSFKHIINPSLMSFSNLSTEEVSTKPLHIWYTQIK